MLAVGVAGWIVAWPVMSAAMMTPSVPARVLSFWCLFIFVLELHFAEFAGLISSLALCVVNGSHVAIPGFVRYRCNLNGWLKATSRGGDLPPAITFLGSHRDFGSLCRRFARRRGF